MQIYQSRLGFHPCDYLTYRKLRRLKGIYSILHDRLDRIGYAYRRWARKLPHNRVQRPKVRDAQGQVIGRGEPVPMPEPCERLRDKELREELAHANVWGIFHEIRMPGATPDQVKPLRLNRYEIDRLLDLTVQHGYPLPAILERDRALQVPVNQPEAQPV